MLSFILEDLHDGIAKTKYRYYMVPTNAKFDTYMARQDNTMLEKFNQIPGSTNPTTYIYEWLRPAQKQNPMHDPHSTHTRKNIEPEMIIQC